MRRLLFAPLFLALQAGAQTPPPAAGPGAALRLLDRHGLHLQTLSGEAGLHHPVSLEDISPWAALATLAAEDRRFFKHGGVDPLAVLRAAWRNLRAGRITAGGSTLPPQIARNQSRLPHGLSSKPLEAGPFTRKPLRQGTSSDT